MLQTGPLLPQVLKSSLLPQVQNKLAIYMKQILGGGWELEACFYCIVSLFYF